ncbi:MAG TPA: hypothetical protein VEH86_01185 [Candidatus Acidoferrum sp.]|nr:hypothetical protein [Candidatus Acidoferrum sp.]
MNNSFDFVWDLLSKAGDLSLKTEKKKTHFVVRATIVTSKRQNEGRRAIVFLRRINKHGRLEQVATCFECCWGFYYTCNSKRAGVYCKVLDRWASSARASAAERP